MLFEDAREQYLIACIVERGLLSQTIISYREDLNLFQLLLEDNFDIEIIERGNVFSELTVGIVAEKKPVKLLLIIPFDKLTELEINE